MLRIPPVDRHEQDRAFLRAIRGKSRKELYALIRGGMAEWRLKAIQRELQRAIAEKRSA